ncbi:MAG: glycosyltransferase family 2 protein [bacterium]|nr:glycosyltransferase family 2 protein [bacterium]
MDNVFLSIIIPAYNEKFRLPATLRDIEGKLRNADFSYEVIVVDDGSSDETIGVAQEIGKIFKNFRLIANEINLGKGAAVRKGMLAAKGQWRLFMDADNSTTIDHFQKMREFLDAGYEVVVGSRDIPGAKMDPPQSLLKRLAGDAGNLLMRILGLTSLRDTQCGFKCFSSQAAVKVFSSAKIDRWAFDLEILSLAQRLGFKIKEIPVNWINNFDSRVRIAHYLSTLFDIGRIRWRFWQEKL